MKLVLIFVFSCVTLFAGAKDGLKFYVIPELNFNAGITYIDSKSGQMTAPGKITYTLEIKGVLENTGSKEVVVATGCETGGRPDGVRMERCHGASRT